MFERIGSSWQLVKESWSVLQQDRELLLFPLVSMLGTIVVMIVFAIPLFASGLVQSFAAEGETSMTQNVIGLVLLFIFYLVMYTVIIFSNTALIGAAMMRLNGEDPTIRDGFRIASEHAGKIIGYAAISATVGVILSMIRGDEDNILGQIVASVISFAWNIVTFLVIPVLVIENVGPIDAIKRSGSLLRQTWGEQLVGSFSIGTIFGLITVAVIFLIGGPIMALVIATESVVLIIIGVAAVVLLVAAINLVGGALNGIFQAALYKYATEGSTGDVFREDLVKGAFVPKTR